MYQRILVPYDGSDCARRALATAIELARHFKARLRLVHVVEELAYLAGYDPYGASSGELINLAREAGEKVLREGQDMVRAAGAQADTVLRDALGDRLGESVAEVARQWGADLVVTGTHGRRGIGRLLLGSGAEQILRLAPVPVLVIRDPVAAAA